jgi:hypothetical protein
MTVGIVMTVPNKFRLYVIAMPTVITLLLTVSIMHLSQRCILKGHFFSPWVDPEVNKGLVQLS